MKDIRDKQHSPAGGSRNGFSLIEVLLALAIFSIGLIAVAGMQLSSVTKNTASRMNTMAVEYASDYMERLLALGVDKDLADPMGYEVLEDSGGAWYTPADFAGVDYDGDGQDDIPINPEFNSMFDLSWSVEDINAATGVPGFGAASAGVVKRITVRVTWGGGSGKVITLTSLKSAAL